MKLKCKRCKKEWNYDGKKKPCKDYPQYLTCPKCRANIRIGG